MTNEPKPSATDNISVSKSKFKWAIFIISVAAFFAVFFLWKPFGSTTTAEKETFHRDEKTAEQILDIDYESKVQQMLDSGMTVGEISRETGLRKDVVRKIKNAKND